MLEKYALAFYKIGQVFEALANTSMVIQSLTPKLGETNDFEPLRERTEDLRQKIHEALSYHASELRTLCKKVNLTYSLMGIDRLEAALAKTPTFETFERAVNELQGRIEDELGSVLFVHISTKHAASYHNPMLFGDKAAGRFQGAAYDIEHAGDCLALGQYTATVMHLMRVMESAIDAIALGVGVPVTAVKAVGAWEQLLNMIRDKIQANNKAPNPPWLAAKPFYEAAYAYLHAVKDAWRNPAIHAEQKYTLEEAERIFVAIKNLIEHLAEHLDEAGVFTL